METLKNIGVGLAVFAGFILAAVLVVVAVYGAMSPIMIAECSQQTAEIGFPHRWGFFEGCMIEPEQGKWIPLGNYYYEQE